jgi:hypothetical protein
MDPRHVASRWPPNLGGGLLRWTSSARRLRASYNCQHAMSIWVRKLKSFEDERAADREFWLTLSPDERVALVERIRQDWARTLGHPIERLRRTARRIQRARR